MQALPKEFKNFRSLRKHDCRKKKEHECPTCEKKFFTSAARDQHQATYHGSTPQFVCSMCGKKLGSEASLKAHEKREHLVSICMYTQTSCTFFGVGAQI